LSVEVFQLLLAKCKDPELRRSSCCAWRRCGCGSCWTGGGARRTKTGVPKTAAAPGGRRGTQVSPELRPGQLRVSVS